MALFGMPHMQTGPLDYATELPHGSSLLLTRDWNGELKGLDAFARADRPNALIVFWSFRIMVGFGFATVALIGVVSLWTPMLHERFAAR